MRGTVKSAQKALVRQFDASDCGPACLATVIRYYGGWTNLERIRELTGTGPSGTTLLSLVQAGSALGLDIEGFEGSLEALAEMGCPCILHVRAPTGGYHFIVCFGPHDGRSSSARRRPEFLIADPASTARTLAADELDEIWQSRALLTVRPAASFVTRKARSRDKHGWLMDAIRQDLRAILLSTVLGIFISAFGLAVALFSQVLLDDILPNRDALRLVVGLGLVALFLIAQNALTAARRLILIRQARAFNNRITHRFIDGLIYLPFPFFAARKAGDLIARLNDTGRLQRFVTYAVGGVMINVLMLVTSFTFIVNYSTVIGLWILGGLVVLGVCAALSHRPIVGSQMGVMSAHAVNESRYVDSMRGIEAIKATNAERFFAGSMKATFGALQDAVYRLGQVGVSFNLAAQTIGLIMILGVLGWGASLVLEGSLQIGALVALIQMANMLIPAAYGLALSNIELQEASVAFDRMYQFASLEPEYEDAASKTDLPTIRQFDVENLSFRFAGRPPLFEGITLTLCRGETVLLAGATGSGKSTLLRILLRLYQPDDGTIRVNGRDWSSIPTDVWRRAVAIVPQEVQIFSGSLAENICMGRIEDLEHVEHFCSQIELDQAFRTLPSGFATLLGEGGVTLSGGQQRLVGLCRALYRRPQLLLIDEPITGLDRRSAAQTISILQRLKKSMATIIVSHRSAFAALADRAYVLEQSKLREIDRDRLRRIAARTQSNARHSTSRGALTPPPSDA